MVTGGWPGQRVTAAALLKVALVGGMVAVVLLFLGVLRLLNPAPTKQPASARSSKTVAQPSNSGAEATEQPTPIATPSGVAMTANGAPNVHRGVGLSSPVVGNLAAGQSVQVVGRTADNVWLEIQFPDGPNGLGWVSASLMNLPPDMSGIPVVTP